VKRDDFTSALARLLGRKPKKRAEIHPESPFDVLLQERLASLEKEMKEVKDRVNGLLFILLGTVIAQVVLRFMGK